MTEGNQLNVEPEIHVIPPEFYGGVKKASLVSSAPVAPAKIVGSVSATPKIASGAGLKKWKSPKFILGGAIIVFILVVGGFSYYYIRQANLTRQKLLPPTTPAPAVLPAAVIPEAAPTSTAPEETATTTPPVAAPFPSVIFPFKNYIKTLDTDNDGLTDEEEKIFGTDPAKPDSDSDGYVDSLEVDNLYNPIGYKPVRLIDSGKVKIFTNPTYNYSIFYPAEWISQALDANNQDVMFTAVSSEFVEVLVEDNPLKMSVADWYLGQSPGVTADQLANFETKQNISGVKSPDGLTVYLPFEDRIFAVNYNIGLKEEINFLNTFEMMARSLRLPIENTSSVSATSTAP